MFDNRHEPACNMYTYAFCIKNHWMEFENKINIPFSTSLLLLLNFPADAEDWDEDEEEQAPSHAGTDAYVRHTVRLPGRYSFVAHISRFLTIHSKIDDFWIFRLFTTGIKIKYVNLSVFWKSLQRRKMSLSLSPFLLYTYNTRYIANMADVIKSFLFRFDFVNGGGGMGWYL